MAYPLIIEVSTEKLNTVKYKAGQIIFVTSGENTGYVYYDSIIKGERILQNKSGDINIDPEELNWDEPVNVTIGGIKSGDIIQGVTTGQLLYNMLHSDDVAKNEYTHIQDAESDEWIINHNLKNKYPDIVCIDNNDDIIVGSTEYTSDTTTIIHFSIPLSGKAIVRI